MPPFYPSLLAKGPSIAGRFDQFDLYAGEDDVVTGQAQVADGVAISQFQVLAYDADGRLIPWLAAPEHASGVMTFTGQPTAADTVTINGVVIDFVAALTPGDTSEVLIGATAAATVANLVALINGTPDGVDPNTLLPTYGTPPLAGLGVTATVDAATGLIVTLNAVTAGPGSNTVTLAESTANMTITTAMGGANLDQARGSYTFTGASVNTHTFVINGQTITFQTAASTAANQCGIGTDAPTSAANFAAAINANSVLYGVTAIRNGSTVQLTANVEGTDGNALTTTVGTSGGEATVSGATLTGGGGSEFESKPIAIAAQPAAAATPGVWIPFFQGGVFNHEVLVWPPAVATLAQRKRAIAGSGLYIGQLL